MTEPHPIELSAQHTGASVVARVAGEVDLSTAGEFEAFLREQLARTPCGDEQPESFHTSRAEAEDTRSLRTGDPHLAAFAPGTRGR